MMGRNIEHKIREKVDEKDIDIATSMIEIASDEWKESLR